MTTYAGLPVTDNQNSITAGARGRVLMQDFVPLEKMAHFNRERIPERVVHAKGAGAFGTFTVTGDISHYTRAKLFSKVGSQCETFARFSTVAGEQGSGDADRYDHRAGNDDYSQAGALYHLMSTDERARLVENLVGAMTSVPREIQFRQIGHFHRAEPEYGGAVAKGIGIDLEEVVGRS